MDTEEMDRETEVKTTIYQQVIVSNPTELLPVLPLQHKSEEQPQRNGQIGMSISYSQLFEIIKTYYHPAFLYFLDEETF